MTHKVEFSLTHNPIVYNMFKNIVGHLSKKYDTFNTNELLSRLKEDFNIELRVNSTSQVKYVAVFDDEEHFVLESLRWA